MFTPLLSDLTRAEADGALRAASRSFPSLSFETRRAFTADTGGEDPAVYEVVIATEDAALYGDVVEHLAAKLLPPRLALAAAETAIARHVSELLAGAVADHAAGEICSLLEWRHVPYLFGVDFVDGFLAQSIELRSRGVALAGPCFFFVAPSTDRFEVELTLGDDGTLSSCDLRFGDLTSMTMTTAKLLPEDALDRWERGVTGYQVLTRKRRLGAADGIWAFEAMKRKM